MGKGSYDFSRFLFLGDVVGGGNHRPFGDSDRHGWLLPLEGKEKQKPLRKGLCANPFIERPSIFERLVFRVDKADDRKSEEIGHR